MPNIDMRNRDSVATWVRFHALDAIREVMPPHTTLLYARLAGSVQNTIASYRSDIDVTVVYMYDPAWLIGVHPDGEEPIPNIHQMLEIEGMTIDVQAMDVRAWIKKCTASALDVEMTSSSVFCYPTFDEFESIYEENFDFVHYATRRIHKANNLVKHFWAEEDHARKMKLGVNAYFEMGCAAHALAIHSPATDMTFSEVLADLSATDPDGMPNPELEEIAIWVRDKREGVMTRPELRLERIAPFDHIFTLEKLHDAAEKEYGEKDTRKNALPIAWEKYNEKILRLAKTLEILGSRP